MSAKFFKGMFFVAALWNVLGGALVVILTDYAFAAANLKPPYPGVYYYSWIALFMAFGIGYYMVFRNMYANTNIVILGIIGKLSFAVIFIVGYLRYPGQIPTPFLIAVIGDLVFVVLFWLFLCHARARAA